MTAPRAEASTISVAGCAIGFQRQGVPSADPLLLIHGSGAHAGWWQEVVPCLESRHEVVVLELSGHGDSEHRKSYTPALWAQEITALCAHLGLPGMTLVGHSMGGLAAIYAAALAPEMIDALILVDVPVGRAVLRTHAAPAAKVYATLQDGLGDFRLRPKGSAAADVLLESVARRGLRQVDGGWRWKFDPQSSQRFCNEGVARNLTRMRCPAGVIYGSRSVLADAATSQEVAAHLGRPVPDLAIAGAFHHVPLDAPAELSAGIEQMLVTLRGLTP